MNLQLVDQLNPFQAFVHMICQECRRRGVDSETITPGEMLRMCSTVPKLVQARNQNGWRWEWPDFEVERVFDVVKHNLWFFEQPMYALRGWLTVSKAEQTPETINHLPIDDASSEP